MAGIAGKKILSIYSVDKRRWQKHPSRLRIFDRDPALRTGGYYDK